MGRKRPFLSWRPKMLRETCCVPIGNVVFVGTDDAHILRVDPDGARQCLTGFNAVASRDKWYAGSAIIDSKGIGPPLGIPSMAATCDGAVLLVNVHVGGVPRSTDSGLTWRPPIDINSDVHQVCAHPTRPDIVIAAAGLCISRDAERHGLSKAGTSRPSLLCRCFWEERHFRISIRRPFCDARRSLSTPDRQQRSLQPLRGGMPKRIDGIADTNCIATRHSMAPVIDRSGCLYVSHDDGATWSCPFDRLTVPSGLHIC